MMTEIKLTEEQLAKLARIGQTLREQGMTAAEKMFDEFKTEYKIPPELSSKRDMTCNDCSYCALCGPTPVAWVGVDLVVNAAGW